MGKITPFLRPGSNSAKPPVIQSMHHRHPSPFLEIQILSSGDTMNLRVNGGLPYLINQKPRVLAETRRENRGYRYRGGKLQFEKEEIQLRGGMRLVLKDSDRSVLPVPSGQVKKGSPPIPVKPKPANQVPRPGIPPPRRR